MHVASSRTRFLDALYTAAIGATTWRPALEAFTELMDAPMGAINAYAPDKSDSGHGVTLNISDHIVEQSRSRWKASEPWTLRGYELLARDPGMMARGFVLHGASIVPPSQMIESAWYRDFARKIPMQDVMAVSATSNNGVIVSMSANTGSGALRLFSDDNHREALSVLEDFKRAMALHGQIMRQRSAQAIGAQWSGSPLPVVVISNGIVLQSNAAADKALEDGQLMTLLPGRRILFRDAALGDLVQMHERDRGTRLKTLMFRAPDTRRWLAQLVKLNQLAGSLIAATGVDDPAVMLVLTPLDMSSAGRAHALDSLSMFTATELQIAKLLLNGDSVADIGIRRRQSDDTIRWHVRNMMAKVGARSLADLHRMLALLIPM